MTGEPGFFARLKARRPVTEERGIFAWLKARRPVTEERGFFARLKARRDVKRAGRDARRLLQSAFADPVRLAGTSLRPEHRNRVMVVRHESAPLAEGDGKKKGSRVVRVWFTILRHPRPYAFSRQHHEVLELWLLDADSMRFERLQGANLSRLKGGDGEPSGFGPGI